MLTKRKTRRKRGSGSEKTGMVGVVRSVGSRGAIVVAHTPRVVVRRPRRIQLSRAQGWRLPPNTVNVARPSRYGNPFIVGQHGDRSECVRKFKYLVKGIFTTGVDAQCRRRQKVFLKLDLRELAGKHLACFCAVGEICHGDVLLKESNKAKKNGMKP